MKFQVSLAAATLPHSRKKLRRIQNSGCRRSPWRLEGLGSRRAVASACIHRRDREGAGPDHGSGHGESIRRGSLGHCLPGPLFAGIGMPVPLLRSPGSVKRLLLHDFPSDEVSGQPPPAVLPHSRRKLPATGDLCCSPALSSELGLMLLTVQVVRGSDGRGFVILVVHSQVVTRVWGV